jgi:hypothetical protein
MADRAVRLKKTGSGKYLGHCPFHDDADPSFRVDSKKGIFKCFACGAEGDVFSYVMRRRNIGFGDAVKLLGGGDFGFDGDGDVGGLVGGELEESWECVVPVPSSFLRPSFLHYQYGYPSRVWSYRSKRGLLGYVCRFDVVADGKLRKEVLPYCVVGRGRSMKWDFRGFRLEFGRPIYGLEKLEMDEDRSSVVIVVEGEKVADALQAVLPNVIVVSWMGGATNVHLTDWGVLRGWKGEVFGWGDNDGQGWCAMYAVAYELGLGGKMRFFTAPDGAPRKWDFADSGWDMATTRSFCASHVVGMGDAVNGVHDFGDYVLEFKGIGWRMRKKAVV